MSRIQGKIIKDLRLKKGLSQAELGKALGLNKNTIGMIERGERNTKEDNVENLAKFFGVTVDFLEGRPEQKTSEPDMVKSLLEMLVEKDVIKDIDNIPPEIEAVILHTAKQEFLKLKKKYSDR